MTEHKMIMVPILGADAHAEGSGSEFTHWLKTLENYFATHETEPTAAMKLSVLQSKVHHTVFRSIARFETYATALAELKRLYVKTWSAVHGRHQLSQRRQQPSESIDRYTQELRYLLADCVQEVRTHEQVQDDLLRDSFVSGINSGVLRLRLLEVAELTFTEALWLARVFTDAREQSTAYDHPRVVAGTSQLARPERVTAEDMGEDPTTTAETLGAPEADSASGLTAAAAARPRPDRYAKCYFCGNRQHPRSECPAREAICHLCSTKGHFAKVCRKAARGTRTRATLNGLIAEPTDRAPDGAPHSALMSRPPSRGPLAARTTLVRYTGPPKQMARTRPAAERPTLTGVRPPSSNKRHAPALETPLDVRQTQHVTRAPSDGGSYKLHALTLACETADGSDPSHVTRAPSGGGSYDLHTLTPANETADEPTMRLSRGSSMGCPNDRQTAAGVGTSSDSGYYDLYAPAEAQPADDARKIAAGVGSTRETRSSRPAGTIPAGSAGLAQAIIPLKVAGVFAQALIDTGSTDSFIDQRLVHQHGWPVLGTTRWIFMASQGLWLSTKGACRLKLVIKGRTFPDVYLMVLPALCADVLLGLHFLKRHGRLEIDFGGPDTLAVCALAQMDVEPLSLFPNLTTDCTPVAVKSWRYSRADAQFIAEETAQLLKDGIIEPSRSPWRAQVLVVRSEAHRRRMVIDYSQTINRFTQLDAYPLPGMDALVRQVALYSVFSTLDLRSAYHQVPISRADRVFTAFESGQRLYQFTRLPFGVTNGVACFQRAMDDLVAKENLTDVFVYLDNLTVCGYDQEHHDDNLKRFLEVARKYRLTMNAAKCRYSLRTVDLLGYTVTHGSVSPDKERLRPLLDMAPPSDRASLKRALGLFAHYSKWVQNFSAKLRPLVACDTFPMGPATMAAFEGLKADIAGAAVATIDESASFVLESDASDHAIAATLSQGGRPVAFFSRTLTSAERRHSSVEKEAYAIVESIRRWRPYLLGRCFQIVTDQQSVAFMYDTLHAQRIKNEKITRWRIKLADFCYTIKYRLGEG
uniref:uncharacterized protein n=1 Tax=Myxine glutinosa TaxID=7769 RepID=UPI00358E1065